MTKLSHDDLLFNLAATLEQSGHIAIPNLQLGGSWIRRYDECMPGRVDVMCFKTSYRRSMPRVFEVKVTRSDLLSDLRKKKWRKYLPFCERVIFAFPSYMATADEIPAECGIWTYNVDKKSWHGLRAGKKSEAPGLEDEEFWFAALLNQKSRTDRKLAEIKSEKTAVKNGFERYTHSRGYYALDNIGLSGFTAQVKAMMRENYRLRKRVDELEADKIPS